jgi:putative oxidoreductase
MKLMEGGVNRSQDAALLCARLLLAALLLPSGLSKLLNFFASLAGKGLPYPKVLATVEVAIEVAGPIALMVGLWPLCTALALIGLTLVSTWMAYRWGVVGAIFRYSQPIPLMKNLALIAGLLLYAVTGPGNWSRTSLLTA